MIKWILKRRPSPAMAVALVALVVAAGGVAFATIPDSKGVIHGCYGTDGQLRVVESASDCDGNETAIAWNQGGDADVNRSPLSKLSIGQSRIFWTFGPVRFRHTCDANDPRVVGGVSRIFVEGQSWPPNTPGFGNGELATNGVRGLRTTDHSVAAQGREVFQLLLTNGSGVVGADCAAQVVLFSG